MIYKKENMGFIGLDLDDVVVDMKSFLVYAFNKEFDLQLKKEDWTEYNLMKAFDIEYDEVLDIFHKYNIIQNSKVFDYSVESIEKIKDMGFEPFCLTARGWHGDAETLTREYFEEHKIPIDNIIILPNGMNKGEYLKKSGIKAHSFIDDNFTQASSVSVSNMVDKVYLKNETWNNSIDISNIGNMVRTDTLADMVENIELGVKRNFDKNIASVLNSKSNVQDDIKVDEFKLNIKKSRLAI